MKWPWKRPVIRDRASRSDKLWFARVTRDPFGLEARKKRRDEALRVCERTFAEMDALDEQDYF